MSTASEQFCSDNAGVNYNEIRSSIQAIDFLDCYPVVDVDGKLTGECIPGDTSGYSVCDIGSNGSLRIHEHASEALIEIAFRSAAELQSYIDEQLRSVNRSGLVVAVSSDGLEVAFGDDNHSPVSAEFGLLSEITRASVDAMISKWLQVVG
jgi:hypothetical protein